MSALVIITFLRFFLTLGGVFFAETDFKLLVFNLGFNVTLFELVKIWSGSEEESFAISGLRSEEERGTHATSE